MPVMSEHRIAILEERLTHLTRLVEELSDVVAGQSREIDKLTCSLKLIAERQVDRDHPAGEATGYERPPHY
jgi:SlyX protein